MNILFLGNGFDLYHNLKTSYLDFLDVIKETDKFYDEVSFYVNNGEVDDNNKFAKYYEDIEKIDLYLVSKMCTILKNNSWANYYANCNAEIQGWIDFENEMNPVFEFFRNLFKKNIDAENVNYQTGTTFIEVKTAKEYAIASMWDIFFENNKNGTFLIKNEFFDKNYGLMKEHIIEKLENELNDFLLAFTIYLKVFIESQKIEEYKWISLLNPDRIISFNYTPTEIIYFHTLPADSRSHLHGKIDDGNMVFGTDLIDDTDSDFMHFSKRFQRLTKVCDYSYDKFIDESDDFCDLFQSSESSPALYIVSFIGCSLDTNDSSIFEAYIKKADVVNIYCYGFEDYKKAVSNLINIFNSEQINNWQKDNKLHFWDIKDLEVESSPQEIVPSRYYKKELEKSLS